MQSYVGPASLLSLLFAGLRLDQATYRQVSTEPAATYHCIGVALLASVALGMERASALGFAPPLMVLVEMLRTGATLVIESAIVWTFGRALAGRPVAFGAVLRPVGLAGAPTILYLVTVLTGVTSPFQELIAIWLLIAFVVAIRAALGTGWVLAAAVATLVWAVGWVVDEMLSYT